MSFLVNSRDKGAKALREYELKLDMRGPYETLSGDAKETWRKAFDRLSACLTVQGLKVSDAADAAIDQN